MIYFLCMILTLSCIYFTFRAHGGKFKAKGTIYLSNIRMVFVANKPVENIIAFDMPMVGTSYPC